VKEFKINILDILELVIKRKWLLVRMFIISFLISSVITFILPKKYYAFGVILPNAKSGSLFENIIGGDKAMELLSGSGSLLSSDARDVKEILLSQPLIRSTIDTLNLVHVYGFDKAKNYKIEDVIKVFLKSYGIEETDNKALKVGFVDKDPQRAAAVVNYALKKMNEINSQMNSWHAREMKTFLESRISIEKSRLDSLATQFSIYMAQNKALLPESQIGGTIDNIASLVKTQYAAEIELNLARKTYPPGHSTILQLQSKIEEIKSQLNQIHSADNNEFMFPMAKAPNILKEYAELKRNVKIQEEVFLFLCKMYEEAKYNEANNVPQIKLLHTAYVPQKKASPIRRKIVAVSVLVVELLTCGYILLIAFMVNYRAVNPDEYKRMSVLLREMSFGILRLPQNF